MTNEALTPNSPKFSHALTGLECAHYSRNNQFGKIRPEKKFILTPIDTGRATESLPILLDFGEVMQDAGEWPPHVPEASELVARAKPVIEKWRDHMQAEEDLLMVVQHGDLNPNNALVSGTGEIVLIDLARLGNWPVGYDLCRIAAMLRFRLVDSERGRDWVSNNLRVWSGEQFCRLSDDGSAEDSLCPPAAHCDQAFLGFVKTRPSGERETLLRGYLLGTLWDTIKVLSYVDLSAFKRTWALVVCWQLIEELQLASE